MFYGWWIVIIGMASLFLVGGIGFYSFGVFFIPLINEFSWTRTEISLAITISCLAGFLAPLIGDIVDKYGPKKVITLGALIAGLSFSLLSLIESIWQFYILYFTLGIGGVCSLEIPVMKMVSSWFWERRGLAMGIAISGFGLGGVLIPPLTSYLIGSLGWRIAYLSLGLLILIALVPISAFFIRERAPKTGNSLEAGLKSSSLKQKSDKEWKLKEALKTDAYLLITTAVILIFLGTAGVLAHIIPFLEDKGLSSQFSATILSITIGISILGRITGGYLADRLPVKYIAASFFLLQAIGIFILLGGDLTRIFLIFALIFGLAIGGIFAVEPLLISRYFGDLSFGRLYGGLWGFTTISFAGGAPIFGYIFDIYQSYNLAFFLFSATSALSAILILLVKSKRVSFHHQLSR